MSQANAQERLQRALAEVSAALDESRRASAHSAEREAELAVQLDAERAAHQAREAALLGANDRLMARVEELSATVARLQAQVRARGGGPRGGGQRGGGPRGGGPRGGGPRGGGPALFAPTAPSPPPRAPRPAPRLLRSWTSPARRTSS